MHLSDVLVVQCIRVGLEAPDKEAVLRTLAQLMVPVRPETTEELLLDAFQERERIATTGIGDGIAIPHAWLDVHAACVAMAISPAGLPFDTLDGLPVHIAIAIVGPKANAAEHVKLLVRTSRVLSDQAFCARLRSAESEADALEIWTHEERRH
jgi:mannitol/fructose-specific phosphotransferase system IIA component (Ntr-type)